MGAWVWTQGGRASLWPGRDRKSALTSRGRTPPSPVHLHPLAPSLNTGTAGWRLAGARPPASVPVSSAPPLPGEGRAAGPQAPPLSCQTAPETSSWTVFFPRRKGVELPGRCRNSSSDRRCHRLSLQNPGSRSFHLCDSCDADSEAGPVGHPSGACPPAGGRGCFQVSGITRGPDRQGVQEEGAWAPVPKPAYSRALADACPQGCPHPGGARPVDKGQTWGRGPEPGWHRRPRGTVFQGNDPSRGPASWGGASWEVPSVTPKDPRDSPKFQAIWEFWSEWGCGSTVTSVLWGPCSAL